MGQNVDVLIVGWDGAPPERLEEYAAVGLLPTFASLKHGGAWGRVVSTIPPVTAPAWASFHTGANPGKHGVFGWAVRQPGTYLPALADSRSLALPTFWEQLSAHELRVGLLGFPLAHPAREVNGFWFPGLLAPPGAEGHPPGIVQEALAQVPSWTSTPPEWSKGTDPAAWTQELVQSVRAQTELALYLSRRFHPQVLGIHYQATDTVQHYLWGEELVAEVFRAADQGLATLLEALRPRLLILMSDHGMGPVEGEFHLNTWLWQEGFLTLRRRPGSLIRAGLFKLGWNPRGLERWAWLGYRIARRLRLVHSWSDVLQAENPLARLIRWGFLSFADVDWKRTWAYSHSEIGSIFLNRVGREPQGRATAADAPRVLQDLKQGLTELASPSGEPVVEEVLLGEELYRGPHAPLGPDLLLLPTGLRWMGKGLGGFLSQRVLTSAAVRGGHRLEGSLLLSGEGVTPRSPQGAALWDIAPTVLAYLGVPIPGWMDGHPLEMFEEGVLRIEREEEEGTEREPYGEDTVERLRGLGYL